MSAKITLLPNGPIKVEGEFQLNDAAGKPVAFTTQSSNEKTSFLCRCGQSAKKPFCDGTHGKVGWKEG